MPGRLTLGPDHAGDDVSTGGLPAKEGPWRLLAALRPSVAGAVTASTLSAVPAAAARAAEPREVRVPKGPERTVRDVRVNGPR